VADSYLHALELDSAFAPVVLELGRLLPWPELWGEPEDELWRIEAVLARRGLPESVLRELQRRQLLLRTDLESPELLARRDALGEYSVFEAGERDYLRARVLAADGAGADAVAAYASSASAVSGQQMTWISRDLGLIASEAELSAWNQLSPADRGEWLTEFWAARDFRDGLGVGGRLVAHVSRWRRAFRDYRLVGGDMRLRGASTPTRRTRDCSPELSDSSATRFVLQCNLPPSFSDRAILDDRGLVFMRHGEPQQRVNYPGLDHYRAESWLYRLVDGLRVIHFRSWLEHPLIGMRAQAMPGGDWMSACQVTPRFCVLASRRSLGEEIPPERMLMVQERGGEEMREILSSDEAIQRFADALPISVQASGVGPAPGLATIVIDVPLAALRELADSNNRVVLRWQFRTRPQGGGPGTSRDTLRGLILPAPGEVAREREAVVTLVDVVPVPPGRHDVRVVLSDPNERKGALYHRQALDMLPAGRVGISDLALLAAGEHGSRGSMEGQSVRLSPTFAPGTTGELEIGYVLSGLAGEDVAVSIAAWKVGDDSARARITVTSTERPSSDRQFIRRRLGIRELGEGAYDLIVTLTLPDGTTQERRQRVLVRE
jgi:hypothetical protein